MLHLFNKVYLEFDSKIEINFDRVIISERFGLPMYQALDKIAYGELVAYGKSLEEVAPDFIAFITALKDGSESNNKKIIIYCDKDNYKKFIAKWFKLVLPDAGFNEFKLIAKHHIYNERIVSNSQLSSVHSIDLNSLWEDIGDLEDTWDQTEKLSEESIEAFKAVEGFKFSYEFLLATYLSGNTKYKEEFKSTLHMFMTRWFKEMFNDNRQMILLNITNHKLLETFDIDPDLVDITLPDPLAPIEQFALYADDEIWERDENQYGVCKLEGLSEEKALGLIELLVSVYDKFEGMNIDRSVFSLSPHIVETTKDSMSDEALEQIVEYVVSNPFDTCLVPRFDFQNVNFPLIQTFLSMKNNGEDLSKYRLL